MESKNEPTNFLTRFATVFKKREAVIVTDPRVDEFVARAKEVYPNRKEQDSANFARYLLENCGETLSLPLSAKNLGEFEKKLLFAKYKKHITEESSQRLLSQEESMLQKCVDTAQEIPDNLGSSIKFISIYNELDKKSEKRIYKEILEAKPETIWDLILLDPKAMFPSHSV